MKTDLSSFDIMAVVAELQQDMRIKKVYQPSPAQLRVFLRLREGGSRNLIVDVGKRMYLSSYAAPSPRRPSNFVMTLRKYLSNAIVKGIRQVGFDRIVELEADTKDGSFRLIFELFGDGNVILADEEGVIKAVMKPRRFKHRDLVGKEHYEHPPQRENPFELGPDGIMSVVERYGSLVKALASPLGLGGQYSEEICIRTGIDKNKMGLTEKEADKVVDVLKELKEKAQSPEPVIVFDDEGPIDVTPLRLKAHEGKREKPFSSFNEALDEFFTERMEEGQDEEAEAAYKEGLTSLNMRLREQAKAIGRFTREIRDGRLTGDAIYGDFERVQTVIDIIASARKTLSAKEIISKLEGVDAVKQYLPKENAVVVEIGGIVFKLDLSISASKNADYYYSRSKKAREKLIGARGAAEKTKLQIREYVQKGRAEASQSKKTPMKRVVREQKWYEKFRWFRSSDGFLVIGGRDATSNETVVKRHMETGDVFVHADIHGAPAVVIKAEGREVTPEAIDEAYQFAASNSTAWKSNAGYLKVYWVNPEQVSKTPKSGEYVGKGAFIIRGKRNYKRARLALSIGVTVDGEALVMAGPETAVKTHCTYFVRIIPGPLKSKEAAQLIKEELLAMAAEEHQEAIKHLNIDEIQKALPTGGYAFEGGR